MTQMFSPFDIIEYQNRARALQCPRQLHELWREVKALYEQGVISKTDFDEMRALVWKHLSIVAESRFSRDGSYTEDWRNAA